MPVPSRREAALYAFNHTEIQAASRYFDYHELEANGPSVTYDKFLESWMGYVQPYQQDKTLFDISLH